MIAVEAPKARDSIAWANGPDAASPQCGKPPAFRNELLFFLRLCLSAEAQPPDHSEEATGKPEAFRSVRRQSRNGGYYISRR